MHAMRGLDLNIQRMPVTTWPHKGSKATAMQRSSMASVVPLSTLVKMRMSTAIVDPLANPEILEMNRIRCDGRKVDTIFSNAPLHKAFARTLRTSLYAKTETMQCDERKRQEAQRKEAEMRKSIMRSGISDGKAMAEMSDSCAAISTSAYMHDPPASRGAVSSLTCPNANLERGERMRPTGSRRINPCHATLVVP